MYQAIQIFFHYIGGTKDVDLNLYNVEDKSLLLSCKIFSPIIFFLPFLFFSFEDSVLNFCGSLFVFRGLFIFL